MGDMCLLMLFCRALFRSEFVLANRRNAISLLASTANSKTKPRIIVSDRGFPIAIHGGRRT